ncbi:MAG: hypothetical protein J6W43_07495 [Prevotella sp.]|nr:hypothetical protein [Prevotella sp.]
MRLIRYTLLIIIMLTLTGVKASAKGTVSPQGYMFGFVANFSDSVVYITDIQTVDSVWYDSKTKFLLGRSNYSNQLRNYFSEKLNMPYRTCIVVFALNRKDIEKKYLKMKKLYTVKNAGRYDVKNLTESEFRFKPVNMAPVEEQ